MARRRLLLAHRRLLIAHTPAEWAKVLEDVVHDFPDRVLMGNLGVWWVGDDDTVLKFTWDEWREFQDAVERGEFKPATHARPCMRS